MEINVSIILEKKNLFPKFSSNLNRLSFLRLNLADASIGKIKLRTVSGIDR